ncbi:MAG TPA: hypothetical protein VFX35_10985 [Solirubrobacterales bacterium]|nr:hypothetical protein [Solirubrobacterales bacterium]
MCLAFGSSSALAQPPYEPNDSLLTAYGPLANNSTYTATDDTINDVDYFYFYVTTTSTAQLTFKLTNLGGGSGYHDLYASVTDSHGGSVTGIAYELDAADYATKSVTLGAGKYYLKVEGGGGYGDTYEFTTSGTDGAFGEYGTIAAQCAAATGPVATYQAQLATAESALKKAEARLRKVHYRGTRRAKRRARAKYQHVKETVAAEKASLKAAEAGQKPWCYIPQ